MFHSRICKIIIKNHIYLFSILFSGFSRIPFSVFKTFMSFYEFHSSHKISHLFCMSNHMNNRIIFSINWCSCIVMHSNNSFKNIIYIRQGQNKIFSRFDVF